MKKILLIRLDKIGDLISTMCVDQADFIKDQEVHWVIQKGLRFVPDNAVPTRKFTELSKENSSESFTQLRQLIRDLKPDIAVSFQSPWWVNFALFLEGVPVRAGVKSQWHSFLFLNKGLRQKRSRALKHEADYNLDLLAYALNIPARAGLHGHTPILKLVAPENAELLHVHKLESGKYLVVHAGMAGSALNWPIKSYIDFIRKVLAQNTSVVLTGTPADEPWLTEIKNTFQTENLFINLQNKLKPQELFTILKNSKVVVVPSTGVAHMAASLGSHVFGIYPHVKVQSPTRWAARGEFVKIFEAPKLNANGTYCDGEHCEENKCMEKIKPEDLLHTLKLI